MLIPMKNLDPPILFDDLVRLRLFDELFLPNELFLDDGLDARPHVCWLNNRLDAPQVRLLVLIPLLFPEYPDEKSGSSRSKLPNTDVSCKNSSSRVS